jgi:hypothetical protein
MHLGIHRAKSFTPMGMVILRSDSVFGTILALIQQKSVTEHTVKNVATIMILYLAVLVPSFGQSVQHDPGLSIEQLYLQGTASIASMSAMITSREHETQEAGMRSLKRAVSEGRVDPRSADYLRLMGFVLEQGVTTIAKNWTYLPDSYHPLLRREAAGAIAAAGPGSVEYLVRTIRNDPEPSVTAEAMLALSRVADIDTASASLEVAIAIRREAMTRRDERMLVAGFTALENLAGRTESVELNETVRETAMLIITRGFVGAVRDQAILALARM